MPGLRRRVGDGLSARNALVGRQLHMLFDVAHQQIERALCLWRHQRELREQVLIRIDVIAILHLVEPIRRALEIEAAPIIDRGTRLDYSCRI